ncbi:hypothetical protein [Streptomyces olivochromogenes]|uniref:Uncharacterized protein n=1 Tax=Streptomyces olivochromogenes TaxID=1963 RepID=A0A250VT97_STROL|nr:hypothetical protein [Streptomyces olivochromogenes]KUN38237.1 hypothetical protein AQJ27_44860 [Streptomyces olivochromogenes]GAX57324.1 hypothetical protein SO3561_08894 [Streptomyces olivochromogenes]
MAVATQAHAAIVDAYGRSQQRAVIQTTVTMERLWKRLAAADLSGSWLQGLGAAMVRAVSAGQLVAASTGQPYIEAMVRMDGLSNDYLEQAARVDARSFSGVAADGRTLDSLLYLPVIRTKTLIGGGLTLQEAMLAGQAQLLRIAASEVADAGRGAAGVAMVANRSVTGYVRQVRAGACARCAILAGRWYRWNADFQRHKRCACYGVPATDARPGRHVNPMSFFNGLSRAEQDRRFTIGGAEAIRNGADIYKVVNAGRSTVTLDAYGKKVVATLEGTTRRGEFFQQMRREAEQRTGQRFARGRADVEQGLPRFHLKTPRLTPSEILRLSEDRDELIGMLKRFGYLS